MTNPTLQEILMRHRSARSIAFQEINPHGNNMSAYDGELAVSKKTTEIEAEAIQAISAAMDSIIGTSTVERRHNPLTGEDIDLIDKAELKTNLNTFLGGGNG